MTASVHNAFLELFGEDGSMAPQPPEDTPGYRLVSGHPDDSFQAAVEAALREGYDLWGTPTVAVHDDTLIVAQALIRPDLTRNQQL